MSETESKDNDNQDKMRLAKNQLKEKIKYIHNLANIEDTGIKDILGVYLNEIRKSSNIERFDKKQRYLDFLEFELKRRVRYFVITALKNYKPNKTNREKFEAKQTIKGIIKERSSRADLGLSEEQLNTFVDSTLQLMEDVIKLPRPERLAAYRIGEERVLSIFNPPGKSMGASGF
jgi:hypothetical protein